MFEFENRRPEECASGVLGRLFALRPCRRGEGGFIVVAVLWILAVLAALISIYAVYVVNAAVSLSINDDRVQSEALMSAALELTAYQLSSVDQNSQPARGGFSFRMGRSDVAVAFRSEAALIDLNAAPNDLLAGLCAALGASRDDAVYFADRIVGWRTKATEGVDAEADAYRNAGLGYAPRQAPFASVGELWLVLGLPPALVERMLPYVTVFSGQAGVDVRDAAPLIIAALPGMSPGRLDAVLSARQKAPQDAQALAALLGPAQSFAKPEAGKATRVTVTIGFDDGRRVGAEAVILPLKDADRPYRVLYWRDDFDGAA
jgi:general secretion pathway protein K